MGRSGLCRAVLAHGVALLVAWSWCIEAAAAEPAVASQHKDWGVYEYREEGRKHCYLASYPIKRRGPPAKWDDSWLLVTNDVSSSARHAVSFNLGRTLKKQSKVRISVGKRRFEMLVDGDTAWTTDSGVDIRLIVAMKRGRRMVVSATAGNGQAVIDTFSLIGFSDALAAAANHCRNR